MKRILVVTDNGLILQQFRKIVEELCPDDNFEYRRSFQSHRAKLYEEGIRELNEIDVKSQCDVITQSYDLVMSLHCKQIFPAKLVNTITCVNVHPGYNPINRGWYPQVFALAYGDRIGATIHLMDEGVDSGRIIDRMFVDVYDDDTSKEVYERVLEAEMTLVRKNIQSIISGEFVTQNPGDGGAYHSRRDFDSLCHLDLDQKMTMREAINRLRALSHGAYKNAWFESPAGRVYVSVSFSREQK